MVHKALTKEEVTAIDNHLLDLVSSIGPYVGDYYGKVKEDLLHDINTIIKRRTTMTTIRNQIKKEQKLLEEKIYHAIQEFEVLTGLIIDDVSYVRMDDKTHTLSTLIGMD